MNKASPQRPYRSPSPSAGAVGGNSRKSSTSSSSKNFSTRSVVTEIPKAYMNKRVEKGYHPHAYKNCSVDGERRVAFINELRTTAPIKGKKLEKVKSHVQEPIVRKKVSYKPPQETHAEKMRQWQKGLRPLAPVTKDKPAWR
ncbi:hypothetical protein M3P05_07730 [Sansalvadorimonas sp. 2012CJ34-2]|uniref:Uncharacterized protein n=1 Tax=Parendozoicomonas callyspongiae TaxID=2942213 RepID=A0ABT0PEN3_9GAMM|nr:hypothetical protein [Sansalvadorimonas sp. 2012CJ34-2]MCL6269829.1 hypothetical protein [Sansalvadorimonas sp. 2012CJ34-2]